MELKIITGVIIGAIILFAILYGIKKKQSAC